MSSQQLWQQCLPLTHHSLESFLLSIIERPQVYNLYQFLKHSQISTVEKKVLDLFNLFVFETFSTVKADVRKQLSKQKLLKLKKLTVLSLFQGLKQISLRTVCSHLESTEQQTIDLLIEMSISGDIEIKINQTTSIVQIHYAEVRGRPFSQGDTQLLEGKISNILRKNKSILDIIDQTYSEIRNKHQGKISEGYKSPKIGGGGKLFKTGY